MPPLRRPTPPEFIERNVGPGKVEFSCKICAEVRRYHKWTKSRNSFTTHLKSEEHAKNVAIVAANELDRQSIAADMAREEALTDSLTNNTLPPLPRPPERLQPQSQSQAAFQRLSRSNFSAGQEVIDAMDRELEPLEFLDEDMPMAHEFNETLAELDDQVESDLPNLINTTHVPGSFHPYRNKTEFLLDMLDSLPRLRISNNIMRAFLHVMKEAGVPDVPSLETLRRRQTILRSLLAVPSRRTVSTHGNVFYVNDICEQIARDFSNPQVRPHLVFYPERTNGKVSEAWHGTKWGSDLHPSKQTPMVIGRDQQHFYVRELAYADHHGFVIPIQWYVQEEKLYGDCWAVSRQNGIYTVQYDTVVSVPVSDLRHSFPALQGRFPTDTFVFDENSAALREEMPNPWRKKANGRPVYCVQLRIWQDDVSGNVSKQWNKHWLFCMTHAGLPRQLLTQEYFTKFICCSPYASVTEQAAAIRDALDASDDGYIAYDCSSDSEVMFCIGALFNSSDNPMTCECSSHIGLSANYFCPRCKAGGDKKFKTSDDGYHSLFKSDHAPMRTVEETREKAIELYNLGKSDGNIKKHQTMTGVKDQEVLYWLQREGSNLSDDTVPLLFKLNPYLVLKGFNPHLDCPVEPLHTVLLGVTKYTWGLTYKSVAANKQLHILEARLRSIDVDGMNIDPIRAEYFVQYRQSLIGRQLKSIMQCITFVLHGIVDDSLRDVWTSLGEMASLLWYPDIDDIDSYCVDLKESIDRFLDKLVIVDPRRIILKTKCHILTHIVDDIRRFGPALGLSTETFESYNAVFRACSIHSNHQSPSRDIAMQISDMDRFKHIASGGKWKQDGGWVGPGPGVINFFQVNETLHKYLGWASPKRAVSKKWTIRKPGEGKQNVFRWSETLAHSSIPTPAAYPLNADESTFIECISFVCDTLDVVRVGSFVVYNSGIETADAIGRVAQILQQLTKDKKKSEARVVVQKFYTGGQHTKLKMPTIHAPAEKVYHLLKMTDVKFVLNAQHDCERRQCDSNHFSFERQERELTTRTKSVVKHADDDHFVVNMHNLHHPHLIRKLFRKEMYSTDGVPDRKALHSRLASSIRKGKTTQRDDDPIVNDDDDDDDDDGGANNNGYLSRENGSDSDEGLSYGQEEGMYVDQPPSAEEALPLPSTSHITDANKSTGTSRPRAKRRKIDPHHDVLDEDKRFIHYGPGHFQ